MEDKDRIYSLESLEKFVAFLHEVQRVKRLARRPNEKEMTNTAEHTFEVVMTSWYIAKVHKLDLDLEKVLTYALCHDLIEGYAGDTPIFDKEGRKDKEERERDALKRVETEFAEFDDMIDAIHRYESRSDKEAKFVYAVDKLIDPINAGMEETQSIWKDYNIPLAALIAYKENKIAESEDVLPYWKLLVGKLDKKKDFFFHR